MTTSALKFPRPVEGDCAPYYFTYINRVEGDDIVATLEQQQKEFSEFILSLTPEQLGYRYAEGKWTIAEIIGHILDTERVFAYRCMSISRGEQKSLPGFDQDDYVRESRFDIVTGTALAAEWNAVRTSTILLCHHMTPEMALRSGTANDTPVRVFTYPFILVGHVTHHWMIVRERYLKPAVAQ
jgi:hypothetical protein